MAQTHSLDLERGSSQYDNVADHADFDFSTTFTIEAWIKLESLPSSGQSYGIASKYNGTAGSWDFFYCNEAGTLKFQLFTKNSGESASRLNYSLVAGVWYHVAVTYSSGTVTFFIDGQSNAATGAGQASLANNAVDVWVGRGGLALDGSGGYFDGLIKDVRFFDDVRTGTEIIADARTQDVTDANLKAEWNFNNAHTDSSGNSHTLTANGSPSFSTEVPWKEEADISGSTYLETSLAAYWPFDESSGNAADSTANAKTLTNNNTTPYVAGKLGNAADLERGSSQHFSRSNGTYFDATSGALSFWVNYETLTSVLTVFDSSTGSGTAGLDIRIEEDQSISFYFGAGNQEADGATALSAATWYHVVCTWDTTGKWIYVNGKLDAWNSSAETLAAGSATIYVGNRQGSAENFDGLIDEMAYYTRKLHYGDVLDLYNAGTGIPFSAATPTSIKTWNGLADASVKTYNGLARASVKTFNGLA